MKTLNRQQAIDELRDALLELVDDEHSICQVVGEKRIFCHGFKQWSDSELFRRFRWLAERRGVKSRAELEEIANRWNVQRTESLGLRIACDAQQLDHDQCWGWDEWSDEELAGFYRELRHVKVRIES